MTAEPEAGGRCAECDRIKQARREAAAVGDIERSVALTTLMGVHLRRAHG
ncbi:hypothetical protein ACMATS_27115 [Streptoverticillium reticulum]